MKEEIVGKIQEIAKNVRINIIRMLAKSGSGHPGGSLSVTDLLTTLYVAVLNHKPAESKWKDRDRVVLSKGHAAPALYSVLAECGYFDKNELGKLRQYGAMLQGHPDMKTTPGVDISTGSLGQGISTAVGMALAAKLDKKDYRIYVFVGDGESQEGQVWEAAMALTHYKLDNVCVVLDHNKLQIDGKVAEVMSITPVVDKWQAFGFEVLEIDGHKVKEILAAFEKAKTIKGKPTMIVAHTIKGKGVSFMENNVDFHGVTPNKDEEMKALADIQAVK